MVLGCIKEPQVFMNTRVLYVIKSAGALYSKKSRVGEEDNMVK